MSCLSSLSIALLLFSPYTLGASPASRSSNEPFEPRATKALTSKLGPVVNLGYAAYAGAASSDVVFYGGIPYIQPPVGSLRFAPPKQLDETTKSLTNANVVDARSWGNICIQQPAVAGFGAEDCVTLNIWTPPGATSRSKLPVYVYIHGGGYYYNSAQGFPMGDWVSKSKGGMITVAIQYRLGLLGFLSGSAVTGDKASSVNNGLLDQRAALEWIQRHIAAFGGDPTKVTIGGESAGAGAVALHLTAYGGESKPPFRAAVIESAGNDPFRTAADQEICFQAATDWVGCNAGNGGRLQVGFTASDVMKCWRATDIVDVIGAVNNRPSGCKYGPVIDGDYIPDITSQMFLAGKFTKVPLLAGHTAQDGSIFVGKPADITTDDQIIAVIAKRYAYLSAATWAKMLEIYPVASSKTVWTNQWERGMYAYMESELGGWDYLIGSKTGKPVYNYVWGAPDPNLIASRGDYVGACHTADLFYLYNGTNSGPSSVADSAVFTPFNATERVAANKAVAWWSSFARSLDPNTYAASGSPSWSSGTSKYMYTDLSGSSMKTRESASATRIAWWASIGKELRL